MTMTGQLFPRRAFSRRTNSGPSTPGIRTSVTTQALASVGRSLQKVVGAGEGAGAEPGAAQHQGQGVAHGGVVVDDEDGMRGHGISDSVGRDSRKVKQAPPPCGRLTARAEPWLSTMERVTDRPRPMPPVLVEIMG